MKKINIFCFGFGQVAKDFIKKICSENISINLSITSRNKKNRNKFNTINYKSFQFDGDNFDPKINNVLKKVDYILISIPPKNGTDIVFKNFSKIIINSNIKWITYLSATSVYGNHRGKWVSEVSKTNPSSPNGIDRLVAENLWMSLYNKKKIPLQIFRLSGIYSNQSNILIRLKSGKANIINKKNHFFSRINVEDIANVLFKSLSKFKKGEIYNISDDKPAPAKEVTLYGVKILGIKKPKKIAIKNMNNKMLKSFYKDSKKVDNKKMKKFFSYSLKFPTYVEGLKYIRNNFF